MRIPVAVFVVGEGLVVVRVVVRDAGSREAGKGC